MQATADDGFVAFNSELLEGPQGELFLSFSVGAFEIPNGAEQQRQSIEGRGRLDIGARPQGHFDGPVSSGSNGKGAGGRRGASFRVGGLLICREGFHGPIVCSRNCGRPQGGAGISDDGHDVGREEIRPSRMYHQGGDVLKHVARRLRRLLCRDNQLGVFSARCGFGPRSL